MKKMKWFVLFILVIMIGIFSYIYFKNNEKKLENNFDETKEIAEFSSYINAIEKNLGWLAIVSSIDNYNDGGEFEFVKDKDLLKKESYRQIFIMENILMENENNKNFILVDNNGDKITDEEILPTTDTILAYYPYDLFNIEYKKYFGSDFDLSNSKNSGMSNAYDKKYVYYENKRGGANGLYVSNIEVKGITYDDNNQSYMANVVLNYSDLASQRMNKESQEAIITYQKKDNQIILNSFTSN